MALVRCLSTLGCPDKSLDDAVALARSHGLAGIEIRALNGTVELARLWSEQFRAPAELGAYARDHGIRVLAVAASLHLADPSAVERRELLALAPWTDALGVPRIRVFDGGKRANAYPYLAAIETLRWWTAERAQHRWSVELMVETHDALLTAAEIVPFLEAAPDVRLLWDAHHTWRKGGEDPVATWRALRDRVVHVHVKDSTDVPTARHPFTYVLPGDGDFPNAAVLEELRRDRFAGPVGFEWEKLWHPYLPPLETALKIAAERKWW